MLCISVKLKNLKANHNIILSPDILAFVVYIRKVKKSESKSQHLRIPLLSLIVLCISVKLKNLKANHNYIRATHWTAHVVYIRKVKKSESKSQPLARLYFF